MKTEVESEAHSGARGFSWYDLFATPWLARSIAWLLQRLGGLLTRPAAALRFSELSLRTRTLTIPTRHGAIRAKAYFPACEGVPGVYVNFHGGGYVLRHPEQDDPLCRFLAHHARAVVINVDYDVAPQCPFPIPTDEATDALVWVCSHGDRYGWDGGRLAVGGQSAGGALAAAAARAARDAGTPRVALQVIHYAPLDLATPQPSKRALSERPLISAPLSAVFDASYTPDPGQRHDVRVSPAHPDNLAHLADLPPALVITAELDVLREEGDRFADALVRAGVATTHVLVKGVDHFYTHRLPVEPVVETLTCIAAHLRGALG